MRDPVKMYPTPSGKATLRTSRDMEWITGYVVEVEP